MFLIVFGYTWCAAFSSVVVHGGPEGQKNRFNANVMETTVLGFSVTFRSFYVTNQLRERFFEYFKRKIDGVKPEFALETFDNFRVFRSVMSQNLAKNEKFQNCPKSLPEYSRICF